MLHPKAAKKGVLEQNLTRLDPSSTSCHSSRYAFWNLSPIGIQNGFYRQIHSAIKMIGREKEHKRNKKKLWKRRART